MIKKPGYISLLSIAALIASATPALHGAGLTFPNQLYRAITVAPEASTGLEAVYVVATVDNAGAVYTASSPTATVKWYRFSNLGGGYAEELPGILHSGTEWTLPVLEGDMGYIVEEGTTRHCYWVVDYEEHPLSLQGIAVVPDEECDMTTLDLIGSADRITYYTVNGRAVELDRGLTLSYHTMEFSDDRGDFIEKTENRNLTSVNGQIHTPAPLCDTHFTLSGDRFAREWGFAEETESGLFRATAVDAHTEAVQEERESSNEQTESTGGDILGGSAPAHITFTAVTTPAAIFQEWQTAYDEEFNEINTRYNQAELDMTFTEMGTTYLRFVAADASGHCEYYGPTYTVQIGESRLECPNAFSPNASEGTNDEWKVSYKSIVKFECHIFNRYGEKICTLSDPSQGWDGKYRGKYVPAGVYFYVIKAEGSDGKRYNKSGDINIISYK